MSAQVHTVKQGSRWDWLISFEATGVDFTAAVVTACIDVDAVDVLQFDDDESPTPLHALAVTLEQVAPGVLNATLSLTGDETLSLVTREYVGDVRIEVPGSFGPYFPVDFILKVVPAVTRKP